MNKLVIGFISGIAISIIVYKLKQKYYKQPCIKCLFNELMENIDLPFPPSPSFDEYNSDEDLNNNDFVDLYNQDIYLNKND